MRATREGYGKALLEIGSDKRVVALDADLSESTKSSMFAERYPERFFNLGISEQDMVSTAAGLTLAGKIAFASTFAVFATSRANDQIRVSMSYTNIPVRIVGSHAGLLTGEDGPTHQAISDIGAMASMPNMMVIHPADAMEAEKAVHALLEDKRPCYLRLGRAKLPEIFDDKYRFEIGKGVILRKGTDATIFATGPMVHEALEAYDLLAKQGVNVNVVNIHTIKPIDEKLVVRLAKETGAVVSAEDHNVVGGLGSIIADVLALNCPCAMEMVGVKDLYAESAPAKDLYDKYGLRAKDIVKAVSRAIRRRDKK